MDKFLASEAKNEKQHSYHFRKEKTCPCRCRSRDETSPSPAHRRSVPGGHETEHEIMPKKKDPSVTFLNKFGYNVVKLPRVGIEPLDLIGMDETTPMARAVERRLE